MVSVDRRQFLAAAVAATLAPAGGGSLASSLRGLQLGDCLDALLPVTAFIHVKDGRGTADKFQFLLPGEGTIDHVDYFRRLMAGQYAGDVAVEVSGQIHSLPDYDPLAAARKSYQTLAAAARTAGLRPS